MQMTSRFDAALALASFLHNGQFRKGTNIPYISHLLAVAAIVLEHGGSEDEAIAALLHDAVEDQGGTETLERIQRSFGSFVAGIVEASSDSLVDSAIEEKAPWCERKTAYIEHIRSQSCSVRLVSCADKLHNVRAILAEFDALEYGGWSKFSGGRDGTLWYYGCLADAFTEAGDTSLSRQLDAGVRTLEKRANVVRAGGPCPCPDPPDGRCRQERA